MRNRRGLIILDDYLPNPLSGFRAAEFGEYFRRLPDVTLFSTTSDFHKHETEFLKLCPEARGRVSQLRGATLPTDVLAYVVFLHNAYDFVGRLEERRIPFAFTLYPGGGFALGDRAIDRKLARVLSSRMFTKVITTNA